MKKIIALVLVLVMVAAMTVACAKKENTNVTTQELTTESTTAAGETTEALEETTGENLEETLAPVVADTETTKVLFQLWEQMGEENQFPIMGGHMSTGISGTPGNYDVTYAEDMQYNLLVPAEQTGNIAEAASMIHMMNANSFTCGAYLLNEGVDAQAFADAMQAAIQGNQWMCGFPERLIITQIDNVIVVAFGVGDLMTPFAESLGIAYAQNNQFYDEAIVG